MGAALRPAEKEIAMMVRIHASRRNLLVLILAAGFTVAALAPLAARPLAPRRHSVETARQQEPPTLLRVFWSFLVAIWGKDGSHIDPFG